MKKTQTKPIKKPTQAPKKQQGLEPASIPGSFFIGRTASTKKHLIIAL